MTEQDYNILLEIQEQISSSYFTGMSANTHVGILRLEEFVNYANEKYMKSNTEIIFENE